MSGQDLHGPDVSEVAAEEEPAPPAARQNSILRAYFRTRFTQNRVFGDAGSPRTDPFLEDYVDRQIDQLLSELERKLVLMKANLASSFKGRESFRDALSEREKTRARLQWKTALEGVEQNAGDLWNLLRYIFPGLQEKEKSLPRIRPQDREALFGLQIQYLETEIGAAERKIHRYFFQANNTVRREDVQGKNMLIHLHRVRQVARKLKEAL